MLKVADGDEARAAADCELVLPGGPAHTAGGSVNTKDDQCGLPGPIFQSPHVRVPVGATGHDTVTVRGPVYTCSGDKQRLY